MRKKLVDVLSEVGKTSSFVDDVSIVKRYASGACHALPVSSDDDALLKASKEVPGTTVFVIIMRVVQLLSQPLNSYFQVKNENVQFVWTQFSEINSYFKKQADDEEKFNARLAELISLVTCQKNSSARKGMKHSVPSRLKEILTRMDCRIHALYSSLPMNAMLIVFTGQGDTATVQR